MSAPSALEFLLVSNNYKTLTAVAGGLEQVGAHFDFASSSEAGRDYVSRRKVDGIIVDLDVPGAQDFILAVRQGVSNRAAVIFACPPSADRSPVSVVAGATFLLSHPLTPESVAAQLAAAHSSMVSERRRFFRLPLNVPVLLTSAGAEQRAMITNVSEGGMAVYATVHVDAINKMIEFVFELPTGESIAGKGSIAWANDQGMLGVRFHFLRGHSEEFLQNWMRERSPHLEKDSGSSDRRPVLHS